MDIQQSRFFKRRYKKLTQDVKKDFAVKMRLFEENTKNPKLRSHKLRGRLAGNYSFALKNGYRVIYTYKSPKTVRLLDIGPHDIYKRR